MNSGFITLIEFFRDFIQQIYLTVVSLGSRIAKPMEYVFVKVSDFISINFTMNFSIEQKYMTIAQLSIVFISIIYMTCIANRESNKRHQGLEAEASSAISKPKKYITQGAIFLITTIFLPLTNSSIKILAGEIDVDENDEVWLKILCGISLFLLLILGPYIFYKAIYSTRPSKDLFDTAGEKFVDVRQIYLKNLERNQNPIKSIFSDYSYEGAYFKMVVMGFKFIQVVLLFNSPNPNKNVAGFWIQYMLLLTFFGLNIFYTYKLKPFHSDEENKLAILGQVANMLVAILNIILLAVDDDFDNPDSDLQKSISIAQICISGGLFGSTYLLIVLKRVPALKKCVKNLFKKLEFTSIKARGFNMTYANEYENKVIFNSEIYNKEKEIEINIWQHFWNQLISQNVKYKSQINLNQLHFVNPGNSAPYLKNFKGKVEERFEENTRIMQRIGRSNYENELSVQSTQNFQSLYERISKEIDLLDSSFKRTEKWFNNFCKVTIIPFPLTLLLSYDDRSEIEQLTKLEDIQLFLNQNQQEEAKESRRFRRILRTMHGKTIYHTHTVHTARTKYKTGYDGKRQSYSVSATITYTSGVFSTNAEIDTQTTLSNGQKIQVGKGIDCQLYYSSGTGKDNEGGYFSGGSFTLKHEALGVHAMKVIGTIGSIINGNTGAWQSDLDTVNESIKLYKEDVFKEFQTKKQCLSYSFNISILGAKYDIIINKLAAQQLLEKEENKLIQDAFNENKEEFDNLYQQLDFIKSSNFNAYKYLFFNDIWMNNQELAIINKNEDFLNPLKLKTCMIYKNIPYKEMIQILQNLNLRNAKGKGFFNDKLMKQFQRFIIKNQDYLDSYFEQSDIISISDKQKIKISPQPMYKDGEKQSLTENVQDIENKK